MEAKFGAFSFFFFAIHSSLNFGLKSINSVFFSKSKITHVVCRNLSNANFEYFKKSCKNKVHIVSTQWLLDSLISKKVLNESKYEITNNTKENKIDNYFSKPAKIVANPTKPQPSDDEQKLQMIAKSECTITPEDLTIIKSRKRKIVLNNEKSKIPKTLLQSLPPAQSLSLN